MSNAALRRERRSLGLSSRQQRRSLKAARLARKAAARQVVRGVLIRT
jgi:hypothetical protein